MRTLQAACVIGLLAAAVPARAVDGPCKVATKGASPIAKACAAGGAHGAKDAYKEMNRLKKKLKQQTGETMDCSKCHDGIDDGRYDLLKKDAAKQLDALLVRLGEK
jgi:hypothetical protein